MKWHEISEKEWDCWVGRANYIVDSSTYDASVFEKYPLVGMPCMEDDNKKNKFYFQNVIALCNHYPEIKSRIFNVKNKISVENLYDFTYFQAFGELMEYIEKIELFEACYNIVETITPDSIIDYPLFDGVELPKLTEHDIFEILRFSPVPTMLTLVNRIQTSPGTALKIKQSIRDNQEETFLDCIIGSGISLDPVIASCHALVLLSSIQEGLAFFERCRNLENLFGTEDPTFRTPILKDEVLIKRLNTSIGQGEDAMLEYYSTIAPNVFYDLAWTFLYEIISITTILSEVCPNYELIRKFNDIIAQYQFLKEIQDGSGSIDKLESINRIRHIIPVAEEFKRKYIIDLPIPPTCGVKKDSRECFSGHTLRHEDDMLKLYRMLAGEGILNWDEETCFSFMYRTCIDYKPSPDDTKRLLKPIVWKGKRRELFAMVYHLFYGDTQLWKKCGSFFLDSKGEALIIPKGCINMAKSRTDRIENILKDKSFR